MTSTYRAYGIEGSSALDPIYPRLTLLEGSANNVEVNHVRERGARGRRRAFQGDALTVAICTILVAAGLFVSLMASNAAITARLDSALSSLSSQEIIVRPGDSVWSLASQYQVEGYSTAELAQWITQKNSLGPSTLQPGQSLVVPASH